VKPSIEYPKIVKTAPPIPLSAPKENHMVAERLANLARTKLPSLSLQRLTVGGPTVGTGIIENLILVEHIKEMVGRSSPGVERLECCKALLLKSAGGIMSNLTGPDASL
jgi:hypothetical protein